MASPPIVSLDNFEGRKDEITKQLMDAAMTSGVIQAPPWLLREMRILRFVACCASRTAKLACCKPSMGPWHGQPCGALRQPP